MTILPFNETLLVELGRRMQTFTADKCLGDVFKRLVPFMKIYSTYLQNYNLASAALTKVLADKRFERFHEYFVNTSSLPECQGRSLSSLLIMPVQRVPRYNLLLNELLKNTDEDHEDYTLIKEALDGCKVVANELNEDIRRNEHRDEL